MISGAFLDFRASGNRSCFVLNIGLGGSDLRISLTPQMKILKSLLELQGLPG